MKKLTPRELVKLGMTAIKAVMFSDFCYIDDFDWYYCIESDDVGSDSIASISSIHKFSTHEELIEFIECDMAELYGPVIEDNYESLKREAEKLDRPEMLIERLPDDWAQYELGSNS